MSISPNSSPGAPDIITPRTVYNNLQAQWQSNPWPSITINMLGSGAGTISSTATLGAGLNCNFPSNSSSGKCSTAFTKDQPITLIFSSTNHSVVTNWGVTGCSSGSNTCRIIPDVNTVLNVTVYAAPVYITATANSGGNISPLGTTVINYGASKVYTITPNAGFYIASVVVNGKALTGVLPTVYDFSYITDDQTISVTFAPIHVSPPPRNYVL